MQLGVIGLGTMGANLARNAARNGAEVILFNRTTEKTEAFMKEHGKEGKCIATHSIGEFLKAFTGRRAILLMVKAGSAVDDLIQELLTTHYQLLTHGDILIDAGNSHYKDTERREKELMARGIHFVGMGVSGGEEGALRGPSMMPGGSREGFEYLKPFLEKMAADDGAGGKCFAYIGPGGSGHFVKMVHNGIEYGIMQLIAEAYDLLKREGNMSNDAIADIFDEWNQSDMLRSFLVEITSTVLRKKEEGKSLVDLIKDSAGQKGTGKWTTEAAFNVGVAVPTITAAVDARIISSGKDFRVMQSRGNPLAPEPHKRIAELVAYVETALALSVANAYAQGFQLIDVASKHMQWNLNLADIARIWRGGCIIRSVLLEQYQKIFAGDTDAAAFVRNTFSSEAQLHWRSIVSLGALRAIPLPAMSASLAYFDAYRTECLPQNLIQAQRDFFGAHTYERVDKEGTFHTQWE